MVMQRLKQNRTHNNMSTISQEGHLPTLHINTTFRHKIKIKCVVKSFKNLGRKGRDFYYVFNFKTTETCLF